MSTFKPIVPQELLKAIEPAAHGVDVRSLVIDLAGAGLIRAYARFTRDAGQSVTPIRDARISPNLWLRIATEEKGPDVWSAGSVRLPRGPMGSNKFEVEVIGIRFEQNAVRDALRDHGVTFVPIASPTTPPPKAANKPAPASSPPAAASPNSNAAPPAQSPTTRTTNTKPLAIKDVYTTDEASVYLGLGRTKFYELLADNEISYFKAGSRKRFQRQDLDDWIAQNKQGGQGKP